MNKNFQNQSNNQNLSNFEVKLQKMKSTLTDQEKCKEIARKLVDYISQNQKS